jgi:hypothetical protein
VEHPDLAADHQVGPVLAGQARGQVPGLPLDGVPEGRKVVPAVGEPRGRAAVEVLGVVGPLSAHLRAQKLAEQRVVAVPLPASVQRREQRAAARQLGEPPLAAGAAGQRVRELAVEHIDDRRAKQEAPVLGRDVGQDLREQVVADRPVVAGEVVDEALRLGMIAKRQSREAQRTDPPLGVFPQPPDVRLVHRHAELRQHLGGLREREGELRGPDLGQLVLEPEPPEAQRRVCARRQDDAQRRRRAPEETVDVGVHMVADLVEVVEHQHDRRRALRQGGRQGVQHPGDPLLAVRPGRRGREFHAGAVNRLQNRSPETPPVGVGGIERHPRDGSRGPAARDPAPEEDRLACARGRGHQRERPTTAGVEPVDQPGALDDGALVCRKRELRRRQPAPQPLWCLLPHTEPRRT